MIVVKLSIIKNNKNKQTNKQTYRQSLIYNLVL